MRFNSLATLACVTIFWQAHTSLARDSKILPGSRPAVMLSRTDEFIAMNRQDSASLYRTKDAKQVRTFTASDCDIESLTVTLDERYLLAACRGGAVRVWEIQNGAPVCSAHIPFSDNYYIHDASFSGDGKSFILVDHGGHVLVYETSSGRIIREMKFPQEIFGVSAALSPEGTKGVVMSQGYLLYTFELAKGKLEETIFRGDRPVRYSSSGAFVALQCYDSPPLGLVYMDGSFRSQKLGSFGRISLLQPTSDGRFLVTSTVTTSGFASSTVGCMVDPQTMLSNELWRLDGHFEGMSFDGKRLNGVRTNNDLITEVYDLKEKRLLYTIDNSVAAPLVLTPLNSMPPRERGFFDENHTGELSLLFLVISPIGFLIAWSIIWRRNTRIIKTNV
ncbi:MAG TPA: hypothetical protein VGP68_12165 [Gemmataceae bacterium]|jgi:WD40 repeat protein|nr:hypothetical protein [Gemmataceae bacterium]